MGLYFKLSEDIVDILVCKTQSNNRHFFRLLTAYYLTKIASMMRTNIRTQDRGIIPVNIYILNLMPSGAGKGYSTNIMEEEIINLFRKRFLDTVFPAQASKHIMKLASALAMKTGKSEEECLEKLEKEFESTGELLFSFDSGTSAATKQLRHKLLLTNAGSLNLEMDEVGSNIMGNTEMLNTFLELYDVGKTKQKLIKNTNDSKRYTDIQGRTPTNLMLFGTPTKLLDGSTVEDSFMTMLETGFGRRLLVGYTSEHCMLSLLSPEQQFDNLLAINKQGTVKHISNNLAELADESLFNLSLDINRSNSIRLLEYKTQCEKIALSLKPTQELLKAEIKHRYYKALKLAGTYAFIERTTSIKEEHLDMAIQLVEDAGEQFKKIVKKKGPYIRLAEYLASAEGNVTQIELIEELPFYKGTEAQKRELMNLAVAYGYNNHITIRKTEIDGIEFFSGESLKETDLNKVNIHYSTDRTSNFKNATLKFCDLHRLVTKNGYHYTAHAFEQGYRHHKNVIEGFDLVILDIDSGVKIKFIKDILFKYTYFLCTTKRHTEEQHRFRIILPLSHYLRLDQQDYSKFMSNIFLWLPFPVDTHTKDIARAWVSYPGKYHYNKGENINAHLFIPRTRKAEEHTKKITKNTNLSTLESWFLENIEVGNRSNMLYRLGCIYLDKGVDIKDILDLLLKFNSKLDLPLSDNEIKTKVYAGLLSKIK